MGKILLIIYALALLAGYLFGNLPASIAFLLFVLPLLAVASATCFYLAWKFLRTPSYIYDENRRAAILAIKYNIGQLDKQGIQEVQRIVENGTLTQQGMAINTKRGEFVFPVRLSDRALDRVIG